MKKLFALCLVLMTLVVLALGLIYLKAVQTEHAAQSALDAVRSLTIGSSNLADVQSLSRKYAPYSKYSSQTCIPETCEISLEFDNRWLAITRFAPETSFRLDLSVRADKVERISLLMATGGIGGVRAWVEQFPDRLPIPAYAVDGKRNTTPPWHFSLITVRFTPRASSAQKDGALAFNLNCLTKLGGCKYSEQMLPRINLEAEPSQSSR
jgi:hypothetical protein